mmetsp:Transcript_47189/g.111255  ORF Transcript_47189/g.111255 Transcript_47189/m.111255 type:complete len:388 (-) Transcript_47189:616-1779(-)
MRLDLPCPVGPQPLRRVAVQQALHQRVDLAGEEARQHELLLQNVVVHHLAVLVVERVVARDHLPRQRSERPPIHLLAVLLLLQLLGRHVELCASPGARAHGTACLLRHLRAPEVCDHEVALRVDENVLGLQVTVHDAPGVELLEGQHDLGRVQRVRLGFEGRVVDKHVQELAAGEVVHDQVQPALALEGVVHVDDVGVADAAHDGALCFGAAQVLLDHHLLAHRLHRVHLPRALLLHLVDFAEASLSDHVQDLKVIDRGLDALLRDLLRSHRLLRARVRVRLRDALLGLGHLLNNCFFFLLFLDVPVLGCFAFRRWRSVNRRRPDQLGLLLLLHPLVSRRNRITFAFGVCDKERRIHEDVLIRSSLCLQLIQRPARIDPRQRFGHVR